MLLFFLAAFVFFDSQSLAAEPTPQARNNKADSKVSKAITELLKKQADAWNRGDIDGFMSGYLNSPDTTYSSAGNLVWGYEHIKDRYLKKYGDKRESMGKLAFSELKFFELGDKNALTLGRWQLEMPENKGLSGAFSLVFTRTKTGWKIMHDHSSLSQILDEKKE